MFLGGSLGVESVQQKDEQAFAARVSTAKSVSQPCPTQTIPLQTLFTWEIIFLIACLPTALCLQEVAVGEVYILWKFLFSVNVCSGPDCLVCVL